MALPVIQSIMSNIYGSSSSYSTGKGTQFSLIGNSSSTSSSDSKSFGDPTIDRFETPEMYRFVKNYHTTISILSLLQSFIADLYRDASLEVTIPDHKDWEQYANICIKAADIKHKVIESLEPYLFYGNQGYYLDHKDNALKQLVNPTDFAIYYEHDIPKLAMLESAKGKGIKTVRYYNGLWLQYKPVITKAFNTKKDDKENGEDAGLYYEHEFRSGQSLFKGAILRLYSMFIKEYLADQMALKESLKNETIVANVGDEDTDQKDISQAVEMISNLVNDSESMSILSKSPEALLRLIDEKMVNYINVVPGIQNFTNFDKMDIYSMRDKIQMLRDDIEQDEDRVYKTIGISKELMNGDSTKYEAMERSSRFVTLVSYINNSILMSLQNFVSSQIYFKFKVNVPLSLIQFNIDSAAILSNADTAYKFRTLQETMDAISSISDAYRNLAENEIIDKDKLYEFFSRKLAGIDATFVDLFLKIELQDCEVDEEGNAVPVEGDGQVLGSGSGGLAEEEE